MCYIRKDCNNQGKQFLWQIFKMEAFSFKLYSNFTDTLYIGHQLNSPRVAKYGRPEYFVWPTHTVETSIYLM